MLRKRASRICAHWQGPVRRLRVRLWGLDAETGVFMPLFLDLSYDEAAGQGKMNSCVDLREAIIHR